MATESWDPARGSLAVDSTLDVEAADEDAADRAESVQEEVAAANDVGDAQGRYLHRMIAIIEELSERYDTR